MLQNSTAQKTLVFLFIASGLLVALIAPPRGYADVIIEKIESAAIAKNTMGISSLQEVLVYTPPDYETTTERYPVIYWLAGWSNPASNLPVPEGMDEAIQARKIPPVIVVSLSSSIKAGGGHHYRDNLSEFPRVRQLGGFSHPRTYSFH